MGAPLSVAVSDRFCEAIADRYPILESSAATPPRFSFFGALRSPISVRRTVRAGEHDHVTVRITHPALPVVGAAVPVGRIAMARQDDLGFQPGEAGESGIE